MVASFVLQLLNGPISATIDKFLADQQQRDKFKAELQQGLIAMLGKQAEAQSAIIQAEVRSEHWLTANWRPALMVLFMLFLVWVGFVLPMADWLFDQPVPYHPRWADLPTGFWDFLGIGMGGYIGGRSLEKIAGQVLATRK